MQCVINFWRKWYKKLNKLQWKCQIFWALYLSRWAFYIQTWTSCLISTFACNKALCLRWQTARERKRKKMFSFWSDISTLRPLALPPRPTSLPATDPYSTGLRGEFEQLPGDGVASTRVRARDVYSKPDLNQAIELCMKFGQIIKKMMPVS